MSARLRFLALIVAGSFMALAQAAGTAQQALLAVDAERVAAFLAADPVRLGRLLADDLTYGHTTGELDDKAQLLGKLKSGELVYQSITTRDVVARAYGTAGVVTGTAALHVLNAHQPRDVRLRYTATYVLRDGHWQLVAYQSTPLPG
jgi:hypothetical protein